MAKNPAAAFNQNGNLDDNSVKALSKALAASDKSRFSYLEFRLSVLKLMDRGLSVDQAYDSVFTTAETIGVDRAQLLKSADTYLKTLDSEKQKFAEAMDKRLTDGVAADVQRMEKLTAQIEKLEEQKKQIEDKIAQGKTRFAQLEEELESVRQRVKERGVKFEEAYASIREQVAEDHDAMKSYSA